MIRIHGHLSELQTRNRSKVFAGEISLRNTQAKTHIPVGSERQLAISPLGYIAML